VTCSTGGAHIDVPITASAWIDISGVEAATCSDLHNTQCQPSPGDPQGHQSAVMRFGQTTIVNIAVVDPP
jgi:hypothetical protein